MPPHFLSLQVRSHFRATDDSCNEQLSCRYAPTSRRAVRWAPIGRRWLSTWRRCVRTGRGSRRWLWTHTSCWRRRRKRCGHWRETWNLHDSPGRSTSREWRRYFVVISLHRVHGVQRCGRLLQMPHGLSVCLSVCVCVCLSVCACVRACVFDFNAYKSTMVTTTECTKKSQSALTQFSTKKVKIWQRSVPTYSTNKSCEINFPHLYTGTDVSKGMWAVKLCTDIILQFLTGGAS